MKNRSTNKKNGQFALILTILLLTGAGNSSTLFAAPPAVAPSPTPAAGSAEDPKSLAYALGKMTTFMEKKIDTRISSEESNLSQVPVALNWDPTPGASQYDVSIFKGGKALWKKVRVTEPSYTLIIDKAENAKLSYEVTSILDKGAPTTSKRFSIQIDFIPPNLQNPATDSVLDQWTDVLFTWQKTALTKNYHLQISDDAKFSNLLCDQILPENFYYTFDSSHSGNFYWRVMSISDKRKSEWSETRHFVLTKKDQPTKQDTSVIEADLVEPQEANHAPVGGP